jgi:Tfp pilus assembly protein PilN
MKAVNLLPNEQRGSVKTPAAAANSLPGGTVFGAWVVLGVLAFALVATAAYVLTTNTVKDRKAELARVSAEAQQVQAKAAALQSFADFKNLADQRVATVKGLASSRFDWEKTLTDLSRALPSDVHLNSLTGSTGAQAAPSTAGGTAAVAAPSIALSGCTTAQNDVAKLMSRLRNVRGVTRVALTSSSKDGGAGAGVPADSGDQPCPKGAPPAFDLTIYFERAAVVAGAAPNLAPTAPTEPGAAQPGGTQAPSTADNPVNGAASKVAPSAAASAGASADAANSASATQEASTK